MSSQAATKINQKEYLKRYLSGDKEKKKKKKKDKKQKKLAAPKVKIIDDDAYQDHNEDIDEELLFGGEDAPQIVGEYVDVRPIVADKWKSIAVKDEPVDESTPNGSNENDLWGRKEVTSKIKVEFSPSRTKRNDSNNSPARRNMPDTDQSPSRKSRMRSKSRDHSPLRRVKQEPVSPEVRIKQEPRSSSREMKTDKERTGSRSRNQSPPRRKKNRDHRDQNPSLSRARDNSSDLSPPRRKQRNRSRDKSPERKRRLKSSPDQSPPRRRAGNDDLMSSSSRQRRNSGDLSPPRRRQRSRSRDQSPKRSRRHSSRDQSSLPPRKSRWAKPEPVKSPSPPPTHAKHNSTKTLDGKKAGLQDAQSLKKESEVRRQHEDRMYEKMSRDVSGRDAEVQVRSTGRRGRRAQAAANEDPEEQKRKEAHELKKKELYDRWGKGLKQVEDQRVRQSDMAHEAAKPLARYADDEDLDRHLREQEHPDDPMLEYMRQKRKERKVAAGVPSAPVYEGSYPENRFGIRPGYRWDGVNRSNGYERKWFDKQNEKRARQDEAYKYSVEDM